MILVFGRYLSYYNGAASYLYNLDKTRTEVVFLLLRKSVYKLDNARVIVARNRVEYIALGFFYSLKSFRTVSTYGPGFLPWKNVCIIHDLLFLDFPEYFSLRFRYTRLLYFFFGALSREIVTVSHYSKKSLNDYFRRSAKVVPYSIPAVLNIERYLDECREPYYINIGRFEERKGQYDFICSYIDQEMNYILIFVGSDSGTLSSCKDLVKANKLENRIQFLNDICEKDKIALLVGAKAYLQLSKCEGFGIPILEALIYKVPVIGLINSALQDFRSGYSIICDDYSEICTKLEKEEFKPPVFNSNSYKLSNYLEEWEKLFS